MNELVPSEFFVSQNYPNPFKERTKIKFCVAYKTRVQIKVYNSEGEEIEKLVDETKQPGAYEVEFSPCRSGENWHLKGITYSYSLEAGDYKTEKKMQLIK